MKKETSKFISLFLSFGMVLNIILIAPYSVKAQAPEKNYYTPNVQEYSPMEDNGNSASNKKHKIYWAQGITPPKMPENEAENGTKGYFFKEDFGNGFISYGAPIEENVGYFDVNKDLDARPTESHLCYLAAATNILHWWLLQNKDYINTYLNELKTGSSFSQPDELVNILPYDKSMWDNILAAPPMTFVQGKGYMQEIANSKLANTEFNQYFLRDEGFFPHLVIDFFINGFPAQPDPELVPYNTPATFKPDKNGGFFYPVFGREPITKIYKEAKHLKYDFFNESLDDLLNEGNGVMLSYYASTNVAHAITVWGAEYDENGNICRLFITDSDDFSNNIKGSDHIRGMHSTEIRKGENGHAILTSQEDVDAKKGALVQGLYTLNLAKDKWETVLSDLSAPTSPIILSNPLDSNYALGSTALPLTVSAKDPVDRGFLTYQWYVSDTPNGKGNKIIDAEKSSYTPKISSGTPETKYYYCAISNNKNGKQSTLETARAKISVQDIKKVDAEVPKVTFKNDTVQYEQGTKPSPLKVTASVSKGTLSYQWYEASDNSGANPRILKGETNSTLEINTSEIRNLYYFCIVTNTDMSATGTKIQSVKTSTKRIKIVENKRTDAMPPDIYEVPAMATYKQNDKATPLKVGANSLDSGVLSYQWYEGTSEYGPFSKISGATNNTFLPSTKEIGNKYYYCEITNTKADLSGNQKAVSKTYPVMISVTKKVDPPRPPEPPKPTRPTTITSATYKVTSNYISKISVGTSIATLKSRINEKQYIKIFKNGSEITDKSTPIATGMQIRLMDGNKITKTVTAVVTGDVNGDGAIGPSDMILIKADLLKKKHLSGEFYKAADIDGNGSTTLTDFIQIKAKLLGKGNITPR